MSDFAECMHHNYISVKGNSYKIITQLGNLN